MARDSRERGLRHLAFYIAKDHCICECSRPLVVFQWPEACKCIRTAWSNLTEALQRGEIIATQVTDSGSRTVGPTEFLNANFNLRESQYSLLSHSGELLFRQTDFAVEVTPEPVPFSESERLEWMGQQKMMKADDALKLYRIHPRHCRIKQPEFRKEWKLVKGTQRGNPGGPRRSKS